MRGVWQRWFLVAIVATGSVSAGVGGALAGPIRQLELGVGAGYRVDDLDWNKAGLGPTNYVNILSELTWEDLEIYQVRGKGRVSLGRENAPVSFYLRGLAGYGWIVDGENQDSDFEGNDRTLEFSRSNNDAGDGEVLDASIGAGPSLRFGDGRWIVSPLLGWSYHEQNLTITDGVQVIQTKNPALIGPIFGLDSTYETQWWGPWLGLDLEGRAARRLRLTGTFEYHWPDYEAVANWNLRSDLAHPKSREHIAKNGEGIVLALAADYSLSRRWSVKLVVDYQDWQMRNGVERIFFASGTIAEDPLNEVNWESFSVNLGVNFRFF